MDFDEGWKHEWDEEERWTPSKWAWALGALSSERLSPQGREGLSYARSLANGLAAGTEELARERGSGPSGRTIRRRIERARRELERELRLCAREGCDVRLPPAATARRLFCSGACRVAVFRGAERRALPPRTATVKRRQARRRASLPRAAGKRPLARLAAAERERRGRL